MRMRQAFANKSLEGVSITIDVTVDLHLGFLKGRFLSLSALITLDRKVASISKFDRPTGSQFAALRRHGCPSW